ncbi:MAG TPA: radical SAM protein [Gemmata sp.]|nr:radical SAM protein [Gemmata sp.]
MTGPSPAAELKRRMRMPQRHRLLHGYPLAAAMHPADAISPDHAVAFGRSKSKLLVGVLPHPFCNPAVTGCGFCVFPHEPGNSARSAPIVKSVIQEMERTVTGQMQLLQREVASLYFGGGTANMTEPLAFRELCEVLAVGFDFRQAEVTLEGVPAYFLRGDPRLLDVMLAKLQARHVRISMGVQTFDESRLKEMGRGAFGTPATFREVVEYAHSLGFTVSGDLLFNLPGQMLDQMKDDVSRAVEIGLDHIGLYHLVLFRGLGTPWAADDDMLAELPDNERACENWLALREMLFGLGFYQTSLTNFERVKFRDTPERYRYEEDSFRPNRYEAIGFGPSAISYAATPDFSHAIKTMNPTSSAEYTAAVATGKRVWNKVFVYRTHDQKVLWLTRRLAALNIDRGVYRQLFDTNPEDDFAAEFAAFADAGLVTTTADAIRPTPKGMFYADSIAAVWASRAIQLNRDLGPAAVGRDAPAALLHDSRENNAGHSPMG